MSGAPSHRPALAAWLLALAACDRPAVPAVDHVLLIVVDTLRADHLGCYGDPRPITPRLDELATRAVLFERAVAQSSWTSPSMVALLTGRRLSAPRLDLPAGTRVLAERFREAGFATAAFVGNELLLHEENGFARGFDRFEVVREYVGGDPAILQWIRASAGRRTFTYVHFNEPHDPYLPPAGGRFWLDDPPELPPERIDFFDRVSAELSLVERESSLARIRSEIGGYADDVRWCDARIGTILDALEASGQTGRTAVVVTADHGEGLWTRVGLRSGTRQVAAERGEPPTLVNTLQRTHGNRVDLELVRVPLLLAVPGLAPRRVPEVVEGVDLAPTLLELTGLAGARDMEGTSLLRVLEDPAGWRARKPAGFSMTRFASTLVTQDGWQLVLPTDLGVCEEDLGVELYDLSTDPLARSNVAAEHRARAGELTALALELRARALPGRDAPVTEANWRTLGALGYLDAGVVEALHGRLARAETAELLARLADVGGTGCLARLEAARALLGRELDEHARAAIRERMLREPSAAVREVLARAARSR